MQADVTWSPLAISLLVAVLMLLVGVALVRRVTAGGGVSGRAGEDAPAKRPWWGSPLVWLGLGAVLLLLGVFVAPHFLPGVVVLFPLIWIRKPRTRRPRT